MFYSCVVLVTYVTYTWKTTHLVKLRHLLHYLGLTLTSKRVRLILIVNFLSGPRPCHSWLPSPIFRPNHRLHLVQGLRVPRPLPQAPFLKPSLANTYGHNHNWGTQKECLTLTTLTLGSRLTHEVKSMFRCETHSHKWGRVQGMKPNDSQMHSHFGSCTRAGVTNVQILGWKCKQTTNWALNTIRKVLKHRWLKCLRIIHLDLICMSYDQKKGQKSNWEFDSQP